MCKKGGQHSSPLGCFPSAAALPSPQCWWQYAADLGLAGTPSRCPLWPPLLASWTENGIKRRVKIRKTRAVQCLWAQDESKGQGTTTHKHWSSAESSTLFLPVRAPKSLIKSLSTKWESHENDGINQAKKTFLYEQRLRSTLKYFHINTEVFSLQHWSIFTNTHTQPEIQYNSLNY